MFANLEFVTFMKKPTRSAETAIPSKTDALSAMRMSFPFVSFAYVGVNSRLIVSKQMYLKVFNFCIVYVWVYNGYGINEVVGAAYSCNVVEHV